MKAIVYISVFVGLLISAFAVYAAWEHNPQEMIHSNESIDYTHLMTIGASWFAFTFLVIFVPLIVVRIAWKRIKI